MILYNTLMGICAALILLISANAIVKSKSDLAGHGVALLIAGIPLTVLSFIMAVTWPLTVNPPMNIIFAEPSIILGVLAVVGGIGLIKKINRRINLKPVAGVIASVGLILVAIGIAIFRYNLVGDAPSIEPISGQIHGWENTVFALVYLSAAIGCLATWFIDSVFATKIVKFFWTVSGVFFLLFASLNYYTHIGLILNQLGGNYHW